MASLLAELLARGAWRDAVRGQDWRVAPGRAGPGGEPEQAWATGPGGAHPVRRGQHRAFPAAKVALYESRCNAFAAAQKGSAGCGLATLRGEVHLAKTC